MKVPAMQYDPARLGGVAVFAGTRVPVSALWDYLESGDSLDRFLEDFPSVSRRQTVAVLEAAKDSMLHEHPAG